MTRTSQFILIGSDDAVKKAAKFIRSLYAFKSIVHCSVVWKPSQEFLETCRDAGAQIIPTTPETWIIGATQNICNDKRIAATIQEAHSRYLSVHSSVTFTDAASQELGLVILQSPTITRDYYSYWVTRDLELDVITYLRRCRHACIVMAPTDAAFHDEAICLASGFRIIRGKLQSWVTLTLPQNTTFEAHDELRQLFDVTLFQNNQELTIWGDKTTPQKCANYIKRIIQDIGEGKTFVMYITKSLGWSDHVRKNLASRCTVRIDPYDKWFVCCGHHLDIGRIKRYMERM